MTTTSQRKGLRPHRLAAAGVGAAAVVVLAGCASVAPSALELATDQARSTERGFRTALDDSVVARPSATGERLRQLVADRLRGQPVTVAFAGPPALQPDGTVQLDASFDGAGETGGGGSYEKVRARLCVRYVVSSGAVEPAVRVIDADCTPEQRDPPGPLPGGADVFVQLGR